MRKKTSIADTVQKELLRRAEASLRYLQIEWKQFGRVRPLALTWLGEEIVDDRGLPLRDVVVCRLPEDAAKRPAVLAGMVARTKAQALLVIQQNESNVKAIFETARGTTTWHYSVEDRVDHKMLVRCSVEHDVDSTGLLCRKNMKN